MKNTEIQLRNICRVIWVDPIHKQEDFLKGLQQENFKLLLGEHFRSYFDMEEAFKVTKQQKKNFHVIVCSKDKVEEFISAMSGYELDNVYKKCIVLSHRRTEIRELKECEALKDSYELIEQIYFIQKLLLEIDKNVDTNKFESPDFGLIPLTLNLNASLTPTSALIWIKQPNFRFKIDSNIQISCITEEKASSLIMQPSQKDFIIITTEMTQQCKKWLSNCQNLLMMIVYDHNNEYSLYNGDMYDPSFQVVPDIETLKASIQRIIGDA